MTAFNQASLVEAQGTAILLPYLEQKASRGRLVRTAAGLSARTVQRQLGVLVLDLDDDTFRFLEIKVERTWGGNIFLETWSNRNLDDSDAHTEHGINPGWLVTSGRSLPLLLPRH